MTSFKLFLRGVLDHRARRLIVITATSVIGLIGVLPAADKYFALRAEQKRLASELEETQLDVSRLESVKVDHAESAERLSRMRGRALSDSQIDELRDELILLVRKSKCQFRRIEVNVPQLRRWRGGNDDPLQLHTAQEQDAVAARTGYDLWSNQITMSVSGSLAEVQAFLASVQELDKMLYVSTVQIQPDSSRDLQMRVDVLLFGLEKSQRTDLGPLDLEPPLEDA